MEIIRCNKGHFYDSEEYTTCPYCAGQSKRPEGILPTEAFIKTGVQNDAVPETAPATKGDVQKYPPTMNSGSTVQAPPPTGHVYKGEIQQNFNPVVGWLVCVEGPARGKDYCVHNQTNFIGRDSGSDICIPEDGSISAHHSAKIIYDDVARTFYFSCADGRNNLRLNGELVMNSARIQAYDVLQVGVSKLLFVPLCGDRFDWNEG